MRLRLLRACRMEDSIAVMGGRGFCLSLRAALYNIVSPQWALDTDSTYGGAGVSAS